MILIYKTKWDNYISHDGLWKIVSFYKRGWVIYIRDNSNKFTGCRVEKVTSTLHEALVYIDEETDASASILQKRSTIF